MPTSEIEIGPCECGQCGAAFHYENDNATSSDYCPACEAADEAAARLEEEREEAISEAQSELEEAESDLESALEEMKEIRERIADARKAIKTAKRKLERLV
jgi:peptidoglycan hydrolase CwlO-like protein